MKAILGLFVFISLFSFSNAQAQWQTSNNGCYAYTDCYARNYYGQLYVTHQISCQTYGSAYAYGPSYTSQACQWTTVPGVSVACAGYTQVATPNGVMWAWQNFNYFCN